MLILFPFQTILYSEARLIFLKLAFNHVTPNLLSCPPSGPTNIQPASQGWYLLLCTLPSPWLFFSSKHQHWFLYILNTNWMPTNSSTRFIAKRQYNLVGKTDWTSYLIWILTPLNISYMTSGKFLNLSVLQFPNCRMESLWLLLRGLN